MTHAQSITSILIKASLSSASAFEHFQRRATLSELTFVLERRIFLNKKCKAVYIVLATQKFGLLAEILQYLSQRLLNVFGQIEII
jgi:hypothetical protein